MDILPPNFPLLYHDVPWDVRGAPADSITKTILRTCLSLAWLTSDVFKRRCLPARICCACDVVAPRLRGHSYTKTIVGTGAADSMKRRSADPSLLLVATLFSLLLFVTAMSSLLLTLTLLRFGSWVNSSAPGAPASRRAAHLYTIGPSGFPAVQPPACTPPDTCQPISAAPPCCTRGRGASSVRGTPPPLGSMLRSVLRRVIGDKAASTASAAPLRRLRYNRYAGAAQPEARDQALPSGCLMREALIGWDVVATHMCPDSTANPSCSHRDCDGQVSCVTAH